MLKIKAFEDMRKAITSLYIVPSKFFLLKSSLYELVKLENKLLYEKNPFNSNQWEKFKEKRVFAKLCDSVFNQRERIVNILDYFYDKTIQVLKSSKINFDKSFMAYVNTDPFQKCEVLLKVLL